MLLHGYLSSKEAFTAQIEYFSRFYRVTALDFIGFGKSEALPSPFSVSDYAAWTKEALTLLRIENPFVIAHSFGCRVAVKLAAQGYPFEKMILTGAAGVILKRGLAYQWKVKAYRLVKKIAPRFAERKFGSKEYRSLSPLMKESYKKIVNEDLRTEAEKISAPVLMIQGREDKTTPLAEANVYLAHLRRGGIRVMQGGHFAFAEYPLLFNLIVEEFLYDGRSKTSDSGADNFSASLPFDGEAGGGDATERL